MFECNIAHRRSVAALCVLYKNRCNLMHPLYGCLPGPYLPVRFTWGSLHRYTSAPPGWGTSQYGRTFTPLSCQYLCGTILVTPYSMVWDWGVSRGGQCPVIGIANALFFLSYCFPFLLSFYVLVLWGWVLRTDRMLISFSQRCIANFF